MDILKKAQLFKTNRTNSQWYFFWYEEKTENGVKTMIRQKDSFNINNIRDHKKRLKCANEIIKFLGTALKKGTSPNRDEVNTIVSKAIEAQKPLQKNTFNHHVEEYIELRSPLLSKATTQTLIQTKNLLSLFSNEVLGKNFIDYEDFNNVFPLKFKAFCYKSPRNHSNNYVSKRLDHIRQFLADAVEQDKVEAKQLWTSKKYRQKRVEVDDIALSMKELEMINRLNLEGLNKATRDIFLFASLTGGLRFSDFSNIKEENFLTMTNEGREIKMIKIITQKTKTKVVIPLHPIVLQILERNDGKLPECPLNSVFNKNIKAIFRKAGLIEKISLRKNTEGITKTVLVEKCECVSAHTARRTFATIGFLDWKVPASILMSITGHSTESEFFNYIKLKSEFAAFEMEKYMRQ